MTSTTPTKSDTRAVIPITTPSSFTQHIIGSVTSIFSPRSDCYIAAIDPDHFQSAPTALNAEIFPGFWCIPPNYFQSSSTVPWSSQCWPTQAESDDDTFRHFVGPYSPGLHCMEGWTTAMKMEPAISGGHAYVVSDRTLTPESYFSFYYPSSTLLSDESGAICCPSGFKFNTLPDPGDLVACTSWITTGTFTAFSCWGNAYTANSLTVMTVGPGITHEISVSDSYYSTWSTDSYSGASAKITVFPMQMLWKASDRPQSPSPDSNSYKEDSSTPKVSRAVVIGVSVAAGIALITAFVLLLLFMRYLKRRETVNSSNTANPAEKAELNGIPATRTNNIGIQEEGHRRSNDIPEAIYEIGGNSRAFPTVSNQPQEIANSSQSEAYDERRRFSSQDPNLAELAASPSLNKVLPTKRKE